jgi:hypothetical protein
MGQMNVRASDELLDELRRRAREEGVSLNAWVVRVLEAAVNPDLARTDVERVRERLARAGILADLPAPPGPPPDPAEVREAWRRASRGTPLSQLVSEGRD